ncbi:MAG: HD domain-containing protein [Candidatus Buchananbacteria bacterium]|nr:HD domain-containing protein [Candidatus Buchananbacteria bacterium]
MSDFKNTADFLFEVGMLAKTPRSGFFFLGSGQQSVSEHTTRTIYIGYALAMLDQDKNIDTNKVIKMCIFHDLSEARISDLNYVHQKYTEKKEHEALKDLTSTLPFGPDIENIITEYEKRETKESKIAKDADNLEFLISLKEQVDIGNTRAESWIPAIKKRLYTNGAAELAETIMAMDSDHWWFGDKNDEWWINRNKKTTSL